MIVALADDKVKRSELDAIARLVGPGKLLENIDELRQMSDEERWAHLAELASVLEVKLSPTRRLKVIEDLTAIALADRKVHQNEREVLYAIASHLGFPADAVEAAIARFGQAVD